MQRPSVQYPALEAAAAVKPTRALVGGYAGTETPSRGIAAVSVDPGSGEMVLDGSFTHVPNPFHLLLSPSGRTLYVASNVVEGRVFALQVGGELAPLGDQSAEGAGTVHLGLHPNGRHLFAVNHDSGSVVVLPVNPDESVGPVTQLVQHIGPGAHPEAQQCPHPHMAVVDPTGTRLLVPDKGNDYVYVYHLDVETGRLTPQSQVYLGSGVGPRQLVFHPSGRYLYVISELVSTITTCGYDPDTGVLWTVGSTPTLPPGIELWNAPSGIAISGDGRFVYAANRGHESIAVLAVESGGARLRLVTTHQVGTPVTTLPWDIVLDPTGTLLYVANQLAATVATLAVDQSSGLLAPTGRSVAVPTPACVALI